MDGGNVQGKKKKKKKTDRQQIRGQNSVMCKFKKTNHSIKEQTDKEMLFLKDEINIIEKKKKTNKHK